MNLFKAAIDPINFWTSWRLSGAFILVMADTFSWLGSISRWETIYLSSFPEGTLKVHFSGFNIILNFLRFVKGLCQVRDEPFFFLSLYHHIVNIHFCIMPKL
jgi:hypothetical protein